MDSYRRACFVHELEWAFGGFQEKFVSIQKSSSNMYVFIDLVIMGDGGLSRGKERGSSSFLLGRGET